MNAQRRSPEFGAYVSSAAFPVVEARRSRTRVYEVVIGDRVKLHYAETSFDSPAWLLGLAEACDPVVRLGDNWDLEGAQEVHPDAVLAAFDLLERLGRGASVPKVFPTSAGGLQLEWALHDSYVEVEITPREGLYLARTYATGVPDVEVEAPSVEELGEDDLMAVGILT